MQWEQVLNTAILLLWFVRAARTTHFLYELQLEETCFPQKDSEDLRMDTALVCEKDFYLSSRATETRQGG